MSGTSREVEGSSYIQRCPECGSETELIDGPELEGEEAWFNVHYKDCNHIVTENYKLDSVTVDEVK